MEINKNKSYLSYFFSILSINSYSKKLNELEKSWHESCSKVYKHIEGSKEFISCMNIQKQNFQQKVESINS